METGFLVMVGILMGLALRDLREVVLHRLYRPQPPELQPETPRRKASRRSVPARRSPRLLGR